VPQESDQSSSDFDFSGRLFLSLVFFPLIFSLFLRSDFIFLDGCCSTVQGLLDWFEVDLGSPSFCSFRLICVLCVFLFSTPASHSPPVLFWDILHCLPRAVGVPLESALNLVSRMSPCGAYDTHYAVRGVTITQPLRNCHPRHRVSPRNSNCVRDFMNH